MVSYSREEVLQAFVEIKDEVNTLAEAALRLGMSRPALDKALERARAAGDLRAEWKGLGWRKGQGAPTQDMIDDLAEVEALLTHNTRRSA